MIMMGDKRRKLAAYILDDGKEHPEPTKHDGPDALHAISQELIDAVHAEDVAAVADALKAAFQLLDSEPHQEGPHIDED